MPISRALLNRLRLPYKPLDIQGSKGDVLYIPDDVGVDLSVMHGVHNGDMVPVKTDSDGIVSVAVDSLLGITAVKDLTLHRRDLIVNTNPNLFLIDTRHYLNYIFGFVVSNGNDNSATITIHIDRDWGVIPRETVISFTMNATDGTTHTAFMLSTDTTISVQSTAITTQIDHAGKHANIVLGYMGYN